MRIGIDLDGVLADFVGSFFDITKRLFNRPKNTSVYDWDFHFMSRVEHSQAWNVVINTRNFWMNLEREKGVSSLNLRNMGKLHDLIFITSRAHTKGYSVQQQSAAWLALELGLKWPTVIEETDKGPLAAALHLDYFIDDRPKNCLEILKYAPNCNVYLRNLPHNAYFQEPKTITRVVDFNEFAKIILEKQNEKKL